MSSHGSRRGQNTAVTVFCAGCQYWIREREFASHWSHRTPPPPTPPPPPPPVPPLAPAALPPPVPPPLPPVLPPLPPLHPLPALPEGALPNEARIRDAQFRWLRINPEHNTMTAAAALDAHRAHVVVTARLSNRVTADLFKGERQLADRGARVIARGGGSATAAAAGFASQHHLDAGAAQQLERLMRELELKAATAASPPSQATSKPSLMEPLDRAASEAGLVFSEVTISFWDGARTPHRAHSRPACLYYTTTLCPLPTPTHTPQVGLGARTCTAETIGHKALKRRSSTCEMPGMLLGASRDTVASC